MATHIDPFAPGDSPQHPGNWKSTEDDHIPPALVQSSVETARRIHELMDRHVLAAERDRGAPVSFEELERRQALVDAYAAGQADPAALDSPLAVYVEDEGITYRWDPEDGWVSIPAAEEPTGTDATEEPATQAPAEPDDDPMAAALAALDATKGK